MSLSPPLAAKLKSHTTSKNEIDQLRAVVARDLSDGDVKLLSNDRRFACYYSAALQLGHMMLACEGYRTDNKVSGAHLITFEAAAELLGPSAAPLTAYFDVCRKKRNSVEYNSALVISDKEREEIAEKALEFEKLVETWISSNHARFARATSP